MGRMLDSLGFQIPQMEVISSDPRNVFEGESQLELQKGQTQVRRQQDLQNFVSKVFSAGAQVAKPIIAQERKEKEQQGYIKGMETLGALSGSTYEERSEAIKTAFKLQRQAGEIGLIDDPYFVRGLHKAQGQTMTGLFELGVAEVYEKAKADPDFYNDPSIFQAEIKRVFDSIYVGLPQNSDVQEGFLSNISPYVEKINSKFVTEANEYKRQQYIGAQEARIGSALRGFNTYRDLVTEGNDAETRDRFIDFGKTLLLDFENGDVSQEELSKYIPAKFKENGQYTKDGVEAYLRDTLNDPNKMRTALITGANQDLVEEVQSVYDELYNFAGEGKGGLGVDPTDAAITMINSQFTSPTTAIDVLSQIRSGTGLLMDTDKGGAALNQLYEKAKDEQRIAKSRELSQRNQETAEKLRGVALPLVLVDADISRFQDILQLNQQSGKGPQTPEALAEILTERISFLKDIDELEYFERLGRLRQQTLAAQSPTQTVIKRKEAADAIAKVVDNINKGENSVNSAISVMQTRESLPSVTDDAMQRLANTTFGLYLDTTRNEQATDAERELIETRLWGLASVFTEIDQMGGPSYAIDPRFSSESVVMSSPGLIQVLAQAQERNVLEAFVGKSSYLSKAIRSLDGADYTDPNFPVIFQREVESIKRAEIERFKERQYKAEVGFDPAAIPTRTKTDNVEKMGAAEFFAKKLNYPTDLATSVPSVVHMHYVRAYGDMRQNLIRQGYSEAEAEKTATAAFKDRFDHLVVSEGRVEGSVLFRTRRSVGKIDLLVDKSKEQEEYLFRLEQDENKRNAGIQRFLEDLRFMSTNAPAAAAEAKVAEFRTEIESRILDAKQKQQELNPPIQPPVTEELATGFRQRLSTTPQTQYLQRGLEQNAFIEAYDHAVKLHMDTSPDPKPFDSQESADLFITNMVNHYMRSNENVNPEYAERAFREFMGERDSDNYLGISTYDPKAQATKQLQERAFIRQTLDQRGVEPFLGVIYTDEVIENFTDARKVAQSIEKSQLDFDTFDPDGEANTYMLPIDDENFIMVNSEGVPLKYKGTERLFTFSILDIGDAIQREVILNPQATWTAVGSIINPKVKSITDEELRKEVENYFDAFPDNMPLGYFVKQFKGNGKLMYQLYSQQKGQ